MKLINLTIILFLLLCFVPSVHATETTVTWYFREDQQTVNQVTGYALNISSTNVLRSVTPSASGNQTVYWGWRVWRVRYDGSQIELTSGSPVATVTRIVSGSGLQTGTWSCPSTSLHIGYDCLKLVTYVKFGSGEWQSQVVFISNRILEKSLSSATWTFKVYTEKSYSPDTTIGIFYWGQSSGGNSRIEDVTFVDPNAYENMTYKFQTGDFVGAILFPYLNLIGGAIYGIFLLYICIPIYARYRNLAPILLILIIFGGAGGAVMMLTPDPALRLVWLIALFVLAGILYKVFR